MRDIEVASTNYLHYCNALDFEELLALAEFHGTLSKLELLDQIDVGCVRAGSLAEIIRAYEGGRCRRIDVDKFRDDLKRSVALRARFQALGCRGFSFKFHRFTRITGTYSGAPLPLRREITLRFALLSDEVLFYPPRVRKYLYRLRRPKRGHVCSRSGWPAIAFGLGAEIGGAWYIFVLQSDLAFGTPSYIRDHFRGWRKVLFASILWEALGQTETVYLCTAADALLACHQGYYAPDSVPASWDAVYGRTATYFQMPFKRLSSRINIQLYSRKEPVYTKGFYEMRMTRATQASVRSLFENGGG